MSYCHTTIPRIAALFALIIFCCGFSWGLGKTDPCSEARTTIGTLSTVTDPVKRSKLEDGILKTCPSSAAGLFIKALQEEKASKPDRAIALYHEALAKDNSIAEAHGNLGLLLFEQGLCEEASAELTLLTA